MRIERHVAQVRHLAIECPGAASIRFRRVTLHTEELVVDTPALRNLFRGAGLLGWLRHRGNLGLDAWHRRVAAKLESQQARRAAFCLQSRHTARAPEQPVSSPQPDRYQHVLL